MAEYYTTGSIQLTNGSNSVTGIGTAWAIAQVAGGTIYVGAQGNALPLVSIESDTAAIAALEWSGATGTYPYALLRATAFSDQLETNSNILSRLLVAMEAGTLYRYDATGDLAELTTYNERPEGFAFLAIDTNPARLYIKASAASGDWAGPFGYGPGPAGPAPDIDFQPVVTGLPGTNAGMVVTGSGEPADPYEITFTIPAGRTGINPRGDYSSVTAYDPRDMVTDNGSSWVALQATTGNAPPVLPTTANAYWQLAARRGIDGTGTGDMVGPNGGVANGNVPSFSGTSGKLLGDSGKPASGLVVGPAVSVDGALVGYSGTSGKLLKALTSAEAKSWLATTALDVVFSNATANLPGAPTTVQAAIESLVNSGGRNDALLALEVADLKGVRLGMRNGVADPFDDATGVDAAASTNEVYDAANDWFSPSPTPTTVVHSIILTNDASIATQRKYRIRYAAAGLVAAGTFVRIRVVGPSAGASKAITNMFFGRAAASGDAWDMDTISTTPVRVTFAGLSKDGAVDEAGTADVSGYTLTTGSTPVVTAIEVKSSAGAYANMALRSVAYAAAAVPTTGRIAVQLVEIDPTTINTDVIAKMSRDGGVTWATAVLTWAQYQFLPRVYEANNINLASLGSGSSLKWEIDTANNKNVAVSGVVMQWS
ncbi:MULTISPECIES: hypothetical protein [unclassified Neorhizobium]|uniref:hypothetical protein n=1 Tax=unclassified Neorhizobium TaxID=2629175 RepID=UPI001FF68BBC|nr:MULTISPECIES: hypothetical protein [unclassified Neorhizobium]MCJ9669632.1 hypothetical protein [Neorhizobium sp. SHOUNA12B]MCJ9745700.1 hypothetical protein [Neorhizobium sp. SHOUNA12A]